MRRHEAVASTVQETDRCRRKIRAPGVQRKRNVASPADSCPNRGTVTLVTLLQARAQILMQRHPQRAAGEGPGTEERTHM
jgi:hypothetical protein